MFDLKGIILSKEVKKEIQDYSFYAANIKQERLIAYSLCKRFKQLGYNAVLEKKKSDLVVEGKTIELKYHFEQDMCRRLNRELNKHSMSEILRLGKSGKMSKTWSVIYGATKDILEKNCDYFVWIISERDIESFRNTVGLENTCIGYTLEKYHSNMRIDKDFVKVVKQFHSNLNEERKAHLEHFSLDFSRPVKSKVHFFVFSFKKNKLAHA